MSKTPQFAIAIAGSLVLGFAAASWIVSRPPPPSAPALEPSLEQSLEQSVPAFDSAAPVEERLAALEQALGIERQARQLLQEEVLFLNDTIDRLRVLDQSSIGTAASAGSAPGAGRNRSPADARDRDQRSAERLVGVGFTPTEAEWIMRRESELQMEALQTRYDALRAGEPVSYSTGGARRQALRQELGDADYERYLEARDRPTRVAISTVLEGSPALAAGLRPGDQILNYDGRRVFSMDEISALTMEGEAGQNVLVDITRDGVLMQLSIPRGPLGVTGGRRFRR